MAIEAQGLEIQIGARTLLHPTNFHVAKGDKIGLVGRNGAGKTTLTRVITGDMLPTAGKVRVSGKLGYLPQDTHAADPEQTALDRMMSARDIASIIKRIRKAEKDMTDPDPDVMTKAMNRYDKAMQDFEKAGGYAAQSEATAMAASLGLPQDVMGQQLGTLSGGQRRRIELARILFSDADTLILDEPTNHLDADSIEWLRGYLKKYEGGFLVISHSTELLDEVVNKVWHLDAQLGQIDMYSLGWKAYLHQRVVDEERRRREREVAEKKAERLMQQGIRLHAKATKAVAAQNMMRRAEKLLERLRLKPYSDRYPLHLSGGQQQRVAIARALMMEPQVLLFDEPTAALDPEITAQIVSIIRELAETGITQVIVTHEVEVARKTASRVVYMENGHIVEQGDASCFTHPQTDAFKNYLSH